MDSTHWNVSHLSDEPLYYAAPQRAQDIIVEGSDAEDTPTTQYYRRAKRQEIGYRYLLGERPFIQSATLRGPFEDGWKNPWAHKSTKATGVVKRPLKRYNAKKAIESEDELGVRPVKLPSKRIRMMPSVKVRAEVQALTESLPTVGRKVEIEASSDYQLEDTSEARPLEVFNEGDILEASQEDFEQFLRRQNAAEYGSSSSIASRKRRMVMDWLKGDQSTKRTRWEVPEKSSPTPCGRIELSRDLGSHIPTPSMPTVVSVSQRPLRTHDNSQGTDPTFIRTPSRKSSAIPEMKKISDFNYKATRSSKHQTTPQQDPLITSDTERQSHGTKHDASLEPIKSSQRVVLVSREEELNRQVNITNKRPAKVTDFESCGSFKYMAKRSSRKDTSGDQVRQTNSTQQRMSETTGEEEIHPSDNESSNCARLKSRSTVKTKGSDRKQGRKSARKCAETLIESAKGSDKLEKEVVTNAVNSIQESSEHSICPQTISVGPLEHDPTSIVPSIQKQAAQTEPSTRNEMYTVPQGSQKSDVRTATRTLTSIDTPEIRIEAREDNISGPTSQSPLEVQTLPEEADPPPVMARSPIDRRIQSPWQLSQQLNIVEILPTVLRETKSPGDGAGNTPSVSEEPQKKISSSKLHTEKAEDPTSQSPWQATQPYIRSTILPKMGHNVDSSLAIGPANQTSVPSSPEHPMFSDLIQTSPRSARNRLSFAGTLPSTQVLTDASLGNPWGSALKTSSSLRKPKKRVSFSPSVASSERKSSQPRRQLGSPPAARRLFDVDSPFTAHFKVTKNISHSDDSCPASSPCVDAMAEAFRSADQQTEVALKEDSSNTADNIMESGMPKGPIGSNAVLDDVQVLALDTLQDTLTPTKAISDPETVSGLCSYEDEENLDAVMDEVSNFFEHWDVESELKKTKEKVPTPRGILVPGIPNW